LPGQPCVHEEPFHFSKSGQFRLGNRASEGGVNAGQPRNPWRSGAIIRHDSEPWRANAQHAVVTAELSKRGHGTLDFQYNQNFGCVIRHGITAGFTPNQTASAVPSSFPRPCPEEANRRQNSTIN